MHVLCRGRAVTNVGKTCGSTPCLMVAINTAILTCTHNQSSEQKKKEKHHNFSSENYPFTAVKIAVYLLHGHVSVMLHRRVNVMKRLPCIIPLCGPHGDQNRGVTSYDMKHLWQSYTK